MVDKNQKHYKQTCDVESHPVDRKHHCFHCTYRSIVAVRCPIKSEIGYDMEQSQEYIPTRPVH